MIGKVIYSVLIQDPGVSGLVGDRVVPEFDPARDALPEAVYQVADEEDLIANDGPTELVSAKVTVTAVAQSYAGARDVAGKVKTALNGLRNTYTFGSEGEIEVQGVFEENTTDDTLTDAERNITYYLCEVEFLAWFKM